MLKDQREIREVAQLIVFKMHDKQEVMRQTGIKNKLINHKKNMTQNENKQELLKEKQDKWLGFQMDIIRMTLIKQGDKDRWAWDRGMKG